MEDISFKVNGLSASTKFYERNEGQHTIQHHEHPETGELVIVDTWYVSDGQDDVMPEFEVLAVENRFICDISKRLAELEKKIKK